MAIAPLQIQPAQAFTPDITPTLANLVNTINQGQQRQEVAQTLASLKPGPNGQIDPTPLLKSGNMSLAQLGLGILNKQNENAAATAAIQAAFGGGPAQSSPAVSGPTVPNDSNAIPGTVGMNQRLADLSQDFIQDNPNTYQSSGVRTPQQQAVLYADRANNPNPVAAPGTSLHERGLAVDIGGMTPEQRAQLPQYGLSQPVANDPVHVQLAGGDTSSPVATNGGATREQIAALAANPATRPLAIQLLKTKLSGGSRPMTAAEKQAYGLSEDQPAQIDANGKVSLLNEQQEKNGGLMNVAAGGTVFDPKTRKPVFQSSTGASLDSPTLNMMADQYLAGDRTVLQNLGRGAQGAANLVALRQTIQQRANAQGLDGNAISQRMIDYVGDTSRERTAATQEGRMAPAGIEAQGAIDLARTASSKVWRTTFVPVNVALQAYEKNTGDPNLRAFGASNTTVINTYARAINPNGVGTVADKEHAREMLSTADSPAAYEAVLNQLSREIEMAHVSPSQARAGFKQERAGRLAGAATPPAPKVGQLMQGYRYKGGNPADPASWVKSQ
jgi:hypothetical protein